MVQGAAFAVFEPFLRGLVAADEEMPGDFGDILCPTDAIVAPWQLDATPLVTVRLG